MVLNSWSPPETTKTVGRSPHTLEILDTEPKNGRDVTKFSNATAGRCAYALGVALETLDDWAYIDLSRWKTQAW